MTFERKSTSAEYDFSEAIVADLMRLATLRSSSTAFDQFDNEHFDQRDHEHKYYISWQLRELRLMSGSGIKTNEC
jgi:hypothetical protein